MSRPTEGTLIRVAYQTEMYDVGSLDTVIIDAGREFVVVEQVGEDHQADLCVVEPDQYDPDGDYEQDCLVVNEPEAIEVIGPFL